jgi:YbbR domain-containing protein
MGRRLLGNLNTFVLALVLAVLVWMVAVNEENPIEERVFDENVPVELLNLPDDLVLVSPDSMQTAVTIRAPRSVWETLSADQIHVAANLAGQTPGTREVAFEWQLDNPVAQVTKLNPSAARFTFEPRATRELPVHLNQEGEPARGYEAANVSLAVETVNVTGPASAVGRVSQILATISLEGLKESLEKDIPFVPVDSSGQPVAGVTLHPAGARARVPISQKQGFRDVAVIVDYTGQVAPGYRITNLTVVPSIITVSSPDPLKVDALPGFVRTQQLDLNGASDDIVVRLGLALPESVSPEGEPSVQVQVNIAAIESSQTEQRLLEFQGLGPGLSALASPDTVVVLLSGPLPVLDGLRQQDVRVILDVTGLRPGTYQLMPEVSLLPEKLRVENVLPETIEVIVIRGGTPTPSRTPTPTPTATSTPSPTRPTFTPSLTSTVTETPTETPTSTPEP